MLQKSSNWRVGLLACCFLCAFCLLPLGVAEAQQAQVADGSIQAMDLKPELLSTITIIVNGGSVGDREVGIVGDNPILSRSLLIELLGNYLKPDIYETIFNVALANLEWLSKDELTVVGITWDWDINHLVLTLAVPASFSPVMDIDSSPQSIVNIKPILKPTAVSGHLDFSFSAEADISSAKLEFPIDTILSGSANVLGWVAAGSASLRVTNNAVSSALNSAQVVHDFPGINGRLYIGMLTAPGLAYQSQPDLYGFSLNREAIVKYSVKPGFYELFSEFTIETVSTVRIKLNNTIYRTMSLPPGNYRVLDLPLTYGLNDFVLEIEDAKGNITSRRFSVPRELNLLGKDESDYSISAGIGRTDYTQPLVSGFYRFGYTSRLTAGLQGQLDLRSALGGASFVYATTLGSFTGTGVGVGAWDGRTYPFSAAGSLQYRLSLPGREYIPSIGFSAEYTSHGFAVPNPAATLYTADENIRFSAQVGGKISAVTSYSLAGVWSRDLGSSPLSTTNANISLNHSLGQGTSLSLLCNMTLKEGLNPDFSLTAMLFVLPKAKAGRSLSFIQSGDSSNSISYVDKLDVLGGIDMNLTGSNLLIGSTAGSNVGIGGRKAVNWGELGLSANLDYGNPLIGTLGRIAINGSTSIAYAGGYFTFIRNIDDSFVLFAPSKAMAGQKVYVRIEGIGFAISEGGRPVILPLVSYKPVAAYLELPESPPDMTPTVEAALLVTGYKSAIVFTSDIQKSYRVAGKLASTAGVPFGYIAGDLIDASGTNLSSTFTDESGNFELYDLQPGLYTIFWPDFVGSIDFEVTAVESGSIELGTIVPTPQDAAP